MKLKLIRLKPKQYRGLKCLNCTQPMHGHENFCSYCGQKNTTKKLSFGVFLNNLVSGLFSYDSRFWRTFIPLLTKPGKVSKLFIEGKRVTFVNPFQMYLNVSIVFFLLLGVSNNWNENNVPDEILKFNNNMDSLAQQGVQELDTLITTTKEQLAKISPGDSSNVEIFTDLSDEVLDIAKKEGLNTQSFSAGFSGLDTINKFGFSNKLTEFSKFYEKNPNYTIEQSLDTLGYTKTFWNRFYFQSMINVNENSNQFGTSKGREKLVQKLTSYISISLFVFLPVFTLFLKLLYIRRKYTYMEHLVFVFHTQTVFFLLLVIFFILNYFFTLTNVSWVFVVLFLLYLYKALRRFYEQGRIKTFIKFVLLNSYYMFLGSIGFLIVAMLSFIMSS